jgi:hypothetical protein
VSPANANQARHTPAVENSATGHVRRSPLNQGGHWLADAAIGEFSARMNPR